MEPQTFSKGAVRVALSCASKDRGRFAFNAIKVEADRLIATDGRRLIVVEQSRPEPTEPDDPALDIEKDDKGTTPREEREKPILVPADKLAESIKGAKVREVAVNGALESKGDHGVMLTSTPYQPDEGSFPEWEAMVPRDKDFIGGIKVRLSPVLLGEMLKAIASAQNAEVPWVDFEIPAPTTEKPWGKDEQYQSKGGEVSKVRKPVRLTATLADGSRVTGVLMPITG